MVSAGSVVMGADVLSQPSMQLCSAHPCVSELRASVADIFHGSHSPSGRIHGQECAGSEPDSLAKLLLFEELCDDATHMAHGCHGWKAISVEAFDEVYCRRWPQDTAIIGRSGSEFRMLLGGCWEPLRSWEVPDDIPRSEGGSDSYTKKRRVG
jgi:hypothetical protein